MRPSRRRFPIRVHRHRLRSGSPCGELRLLRLCPGGGRPSPFLNGVVRSSAQLCGRVMCEEPWPCRVGPGCVRPDHLEAVRPEENWLRGEAITRLAKDARACPNGHPYVEPIYWYVDKRKPVRLVRACLACRRARGRVTCASNGRSAVRGEARVVRRIEDLLEGLG